MLAQQLMLFILRPTCSLWLWDARCSVVAIATQARQSQPTHAMDLELDAVLDSTV